MFLVQLGALALWKSDNLSPQDDSEFWCNALRNLTQDFPKDEPWDLTANNWEKPAFLQPPDPECNQWENNFIPKGWKKVITPDEIDMIVTSKNHDLKKAVAFVNMPEDWIYALVSLQTCEGYGGKNNYGIARMNKGKSSRPLLGLVPSHLNSMSINSSLWWKRDINQLMSWRKKDNSAVENNASDYDLLWCLPWVENEQLDFQSLDPWFIEVCRRIRLVKHDGKIIGFRGSSKKSRIDSDNLKGNTGDPWAPVEKKDGKNFTLSSNDFNYKKLNELLFSGDYKMPYLAERGENENGDMILIAEAFSRGEKTEGFKSRLVHIPKKTPLSNTSIAKIAEQQMKEIKFFHYLLRNSLLYVAAGGSKTVFESKDEKKKLREKHEKFLTLPCKHFEFSVDQYFFDSLWSRYKEELSGEEEDSEARIDFLKKLQKSTEKEFNTALDTIPCKTVFKDRAISRAREYFLAKLWSRYHRELFSQRKNQ